MRPKYHGVKFYSKADISIGWELEKAEPILASFDASKDNDDVNTILELFNIQELLDTGVVFSSWTEEVHNNYRKTCKKFNPILGRFFGNIDDSSFFHIQKSVSIGYLDDFWTLFVKYKVYKRVSPEVMRNYLEQPDTTLYKLLEHKELIEYYNNEFADVLRHSDQTAHILVMQFFEKDNGRYHLPKSLLPSEFESIFLQYIHGDDTNANVLQLISKAQSTSDCPISNKLRLEAKRAYEKFWTKHSSVKKAEYGIGVSFQEQDSLKQCNNQGLNYHISYDVKWLNETLDYPSILNNFRYVFEMFDFFGRSTLVAVKSQISAIENELAINGIRYYKRGNQFNVKDMLSKAQMHLYNDFLAAHGIYLEEVFKWFFEEYLPNEFNVVGFSMNITTSSSTYVEKCRNLAAEMDGVLKQYRMFVRDGSIDRELFEMSSEHMVLEGIPSLNDRKYAYVASEELVKEMAALFSDQSVFGYTEKTEEKHSTLYQLLKNEEMYKSDFLPYQFASIEWLVQRGSVQIEESRIVQLTIPRVKILKDLYDHDVLCINADKSWTPHIEVMINSGELKSESTLFSQPETDYLNYELNKSQFSDGLDLRNKYAHSTYPANGNEQRNDYIQLLKLMVLVITKMNDEFCFREESMEAKI